MAERHPAARFYSDGAGIFRLERVVNCAILENVETKEKVQELFEDGVGGSIVGFSEILLPGPAGKRKAGGGKSRGKVARAAAKKRMGHPGSTQYFGVRVDKKSGRFISQVQVDYKNLWGSYHATAEGAARKVDEILIEHGKEPQNFPAGPKA